MEEERLYALMMDVLDGESTEDEREELYAYLEVRPSLRREWQAMVAIDTLFRQTPALSPAAGFTQRTLARLPDRRLRIWAISVVYLLLLLSGVLPLLLGIWAFTALRPLVAQPDLVNSLLQAADKTVQVVGTVLSALLNGLGEFVVQQPAIFGWLLVMVGVVVLWSGVYRQLVSQPNRI